MLNDLDQKKKTLDQDITGITMSVLLKRLEKLGLVTTYLRQQNIPTKKYQAPGQLSISHRSRQVGQVINFNF